MTTPQSVQPVNPVVPPSPQELSSTEDVAESQVGAANLPAQAGLGGESLLGPSPKKSPLVPILLTLLILATATAIYFYLQSRPTLESITTQPQPTASTIAVASASADPTANWKTYTNKEYGFSFKYPIAYSIYDSISGYGDRLLIQNYKDESGRKPIPSDTQIVVSFAANNNKTLEYYHESSNTQLGIDDPGEIISLGNLSAVKGFSGQKYETVPTVWVIRGDDIFTIQLSHPNSTDKQVFDQILQTFQFTAEVKDEGEKSVVENFVKETIFAYGKSHGLTSKDQIIVRIDYFDSNHAVGGIGFTPDVEGSGEMWFATKVNGEWQMVEETQESPSCSLMQQYQFTQQMYKNCVNK